MTRPEFILVALDGSRYDLTASLVGFRPQGFMDAFCSRFTASLLEAGPSHLPEIEPGSIVHVAQFGGFTTYRGKVDRVRRRTRGGGAPSTVSLEGRGVEAELLDRSLVGLADPVLELPDCLNGVLPKLSSLVELQALEGSSVSVDPPAEVSCRLGIGDASPFEILRDMADHLGYGFMFVGRDLELKWIRPDVAAVQPDGPIRLWRAEDMMGGGVTESVDGTSSYHRDLDDWFR